MGGGVRALYKRLKTHTEKKKKPGSAAKVHNRTVQDPRVLLDDITEEAVLLGRKQGDLASINCPTVPEKERPPRRLMVKEKQ